MERRIGKITLYAHLDAEMLAQYVADDDTILLEVERRYDMQDVPDTLTAVLPVQFTEGLLDYMPDLGHVIDAAAFVHEKDAVVWKVDFDTITKTFDLSASYIRTGLVGGTGGTIPDGQELIAVFTVPGLPSSVQFSIVLPFNEAISLGDRDLMADHGLGLVTGATGTEFTLSAPKTPFTVTFLRPAAVTQAYVVAFNKENEIIQN